MVKKPEIQLTNPNIYRITYIGTVAGADKTPLPGFCEPVVRTTILVLALAVPPDTGSNID